jgi:hypothetical protein
MATALDARYSSHMPRRARGLSVSLFLRLGACGGAVRGGMLHEPPQVRRGVQHLQAVALSVRRRQGRYEPLGSEGRSGLQGLRSGPAKFVESSRR